MDGLRDLSCQAAYIGSLTSLLEMFECLPKEVHKNLQDQRDFELERFRIDNRDGCSNADGCDAQNKKNYVIFCCL